MKFLSCIAALFMTASLHPGLAGAEPETVVPLWPTEVAPGDPVPNPFGAEQDLSKTNENFIAGRRLIRLGNVTRPTLSLYRPKNPPPASDGSVVLVCPGGGYHILAWDLEGTEVCEWLNSMGITAGLLKYRVPKRPDVANHSAALADARQALTLLRTRASDWGYSPDRIGALGFSAGGHLCAALAAAATNDATRLNFNLLIYPAYLAETTPAGRLTPDVSITKFTPPTFLVMAQDDGVKVENPLYYYLALHQAKIPSELHLYPTGGHGYGLRRTSDDVTTWPNRAADWLRARGLAR